MLAFHRASHHREVAPTKIASQITTSHLPYLYVHLPHKLSGLEPASVWDGSPHKHFQTGERRGGESFPSTRTWRNHSKWHDLARCPAAGPALSDRCGKSGASGGDEIFFSGLSGAPSVSLALSSVNARRPYLPPAELVASSHAGVEEACLLEE
jgi:hypothetical protein